MRHLWCYNWCYNVFIVFWQWTPYKWSNLWKSWIRRWWICKIILARRKSGRIFWWFVHCTTTRRVIFLVVRRCAPQVSISSRCIILLDLFVNVQQPRGVMQEIETTVLYQLLVERLQQVELCAACFSFVVWSLIATQWLMADKRQRLHQWLNQFSIDWSHG